MKPIETLNNRSGNIILIITLLLTLTIGSFVYLGNRYFIMNNDLLRLGSQSNLEVLKEYLAAHTDCVRTKTQACTDPIALLKRDGTVFLGTAPASIGAFKIQTYCLLPAQSILFRYVKRDAANFTQAKTALLCAGS